MTFSSAGGVMPSRCQSLKFVELSADSSLPPAERTVTVDSLKLSCDAAFFIPVLLKESSKFNANSSWSTIAPFPTFNECLKDNVPLFFFKRSDNRDNSSENKRAKRLLEVFAYKIAKRQNTFHGDVLIFWRRNIDEVKYQMKLSNFTVADFNKYAYRQHGAAAPAPVHQSTTVFASRHPKRRDGTAGGAAGSLGSATSGSLPGRGGMQLPGTGPFSAKHRGIMSFCDAAAAAGGLQRGCGKPPGASVGHSAAVGGAVDGAAIHGRVAGGSCANGAASPGKEENILLPATNDSLSSERGADESVENFDCDETPLFGDKLTPRVQHSVFQGMGFRAAVQDANQKNEAKDKKEPNKDEDGTTSSVEADRMIIEDLQPKHLVSPHPPATATTAKPSTSSARSPTRRHSLPQHPPAPPDHSFPLSPPPLRSPHSPPNAATLHEDEDTCLLQPLELVNGKIPSGSADSLPAAASLLLRNVPPPPSYPPDAALQKSFMSLHQQRQSQHQTSNPLPSIDRHSSPLLLPADCDLSLSGIGDNNGRSPRNSHPISSDFSNTIRRGIQSTNENGSSKSVAQLATHQSHHDLPSKSSRPSSTLFAHPPRLFPSSYEFEHNTQKQEQMTTYPFDNSNMSLNESSASLPPGGAAGLTFSSGQAILQRFLDSLNQNLPAALAAFKSLPPSRQSSMQSGQHVKDLQRSNQDLKDQVLILKEELRHAQEINIRLEAECNRSAIELTLKCKEMNEEVTRLRQAHNQIGSRSEMENDGGVFLLGGCGRGGLPPAVAQQLPLGFPLGDKDNSGGPWSASASASAAVQHQHQDMVEEVIDGRWKGSGGVDDASHEGEDLDPLGRFNNYFSRGEGDLGVDRDLISGGRLSDGGLENRGSVQQPRKFMSDVEDGMLEEKERTEDREMLGYVIEVYHPQMSTDRASAQFLEASFGDAVRIVKQHNSGWWWVTNVSTTLSGWYPSSFLSPEPLPLVPTDNMLDGVVDSGGQQQGEYTENFMAPTLQQMGALSPHLANDVSSPRRQIDKAKAQR